MMNNKPVAQYTFTVLGEPHGKARHRSFRDKAGNIRQFKAKENEPREALIRLAFSEEADGNREHIPYGGPVLVAIQAFFSVPKSKPAWWRERALAEQMRVTKRPDLDNIVKLVLDALSTVAFGDDRQVVNLSIEKWYSRRPRLVVGVELLPIPRKE